VGTDLDGVFFGCREALPHLLKTKGSIVNLSRFRFGAFHSHDVPVIKAADAAAPGDSTHARSVARRGEVRKSSDPSVRFPRVAMS